MTTIPSNRHIRSFLPCRSATRRSTKLWQKVRRFHLPHPGLGQSAPGGSPHRRLGSNPHPIRTPVLDGGHLHPQRDILTGRTQVSEMMEIAHNTAIAQCRHRSRCNFHWFIYIFHFWTQPIDWRNAPIDFSWSCITPVGVSGKRWDLYRSLRVLAMRPSFLYMSMISQLATQSLPETKSPQANSSRLISPGPSSVWR